MAYLFYHMKVKNVIIDFLLVIQIIGFQNESCILEPIIFCITNEISFRIISLSSDHKFFLECWFSIRNYYYIWNNKRLER